MTTWLKDWLLFGLSQLFRKKCQKWIEGGLSYPGGEHATSHTSTAWALFSWATVVLFAISYLLANVKERLHWHGLHSLLICKRNTGVYTRYYH